MENKFDFTDEEWEIPEYAGYIQGKKSKKYIISFNRSGEEACANYRLISCAPEMLKALIVLKKSCERKWPSVFKNITRDIIEKATGKKWEEINK